MIKFKKKEDISDIYRYIVKSEKDYLSEYDRCIEHYLIYYNIRGKWYKKLYYFCSVIKLVAIGCIPILELINKQESVNWQVVAAGAIAIFLESILATFKAKEKWISYRSTCDKLSGEQRLYKTKCGRYKDADAFDRYVRETKLIIEAEGGNWKEYMTQQNNDNK